MYTQDDEQTHKEPASTDPAKYWLRSDSASAGGATPACYPRRSAPRAIAWATRGRRATARR